MSLFGSFHENVVFERRTRVLAEALAPLMPRGARILDVGCGDGTVGRRIKEARDDISIEGVDVLKRPTTLIPVTLFDGKRLPYDDGSFDTVMLVDVLHHTEDPAGLMGEAARVSQRTILIKDHRKDGILAGPTLRFMDWVGNARHGVALPGNYWSEGVWRRVFAELNLRITSWSNEVPLYPAWASWLFGRSLHFVAALEIPRSIATS